MSSSPLRVALHLSLLLSAAVSAPSKEFYGLTLVTNSPATFGLVQLHVVLVLRQAVQDGSLRAGGAVSAALSGGPGLGHEERRSSGARAGHSGALRIPGAWAPDPSARRPRARGRLPPGCPLSTTIAESCANRAAALAAASSAGRREQHRVLRVIRSIRPPQEAPFLPGSRLSGSRAALAGQAAAKRNSL